MQHFCGNWYCFVFYLSLPSLNEPLQSYKNLSHPPPECPPGVNLRHYTNFLFGRNCHVCGPLYNFSVIITRYLFSFVLPCTVSTFFTGQPVHDSARNVHENSMISLRPREKLPYSGYSLNELSSWGLSLKEHSFLLPPPLENEALRLTSVCSITINSICMYTT